MARRVLTCVSWAFGPMLGLAIGAPVPSAASPPPPPSYTAEADSVPPRSDLFDAPVYYELYRERYLYPGDLEIVRSGRVRVQHYDPVDVRDFAWQQEGTEYSWWNQMQEMRFLLPLLASQRADDRAIAREWLARWFSVHVTANRRKDQWGEPMAFAYRAMVFVYYLKTERMREHPDPEVVGMLTTCILDHQQHLVPEHRFDQNSNHGLIDALGLLETTRVFPDRGIRGLALDRMRGMVRRSVSTAGVHMEHAAGYHFRFLCWVDEIYQYTRALPDIDETFVPEVKSARDRMRRNAYFLQDHRGRVPQIGDTDSVRVEFYSPAYRTKLPPSRTRHLYDPDAGYAIYKGAHDDKRYVVFRQPAKKITMPAHAHSDALAVLVSSDGEVLLGDAGRYSYAAGTERNYFKSAAAHNTIQPPTPGSVRLPVVSAPRDLSSPAGTSWTADLVFGSLQVSRVVKIPRGGSEILVHDVIVGLETPADSSVARTATFLWNVGADVAKVTEGSADEQGVWSWSLVTKRGQRARLEITARGEPELDARVQVVRGQETPMLGWYSPRQVTMRPISTIEVTLNVHSMAYLETRLRLHRR